MPNELNESFARDPLSFLRARFVRVPENLLPPSSTPQLFSLTDVINDVPLAPGDVQLEVAIDPAESVSAYWASYERGRAPETSLGADADYMFTPNLNGCTFGCEAGPNPRVTHVASDIPDAEPYLSQLIEAKRFGAEQQANREQDARRDFGYRDDGDRLKVRTESTVVGMRVDGEWIFVVQTRVSLDIWDDDGRNGQYVIYVDVVGEV